MSDITLPQSESVSEIQQNATIETIDVAKYFHSIVEGGKQYSICLIKDCCRRFEGNHIDTWRTHLNVTHNSTNLHSNSTECPTPDTDMPINNDLLSLFGDINESVKFHVKQNLSDTDNFRQYFQIITEDGKTYAQCLVKYCTSRLSGNRRNNMKKHLYIVHGKCSNYSSSDDDDDVLDSATAPSDGEGTAENDDTAKVLKYYRDVVEDGKLFSKCLIRGCQRRMSGKRLRNLNLHLWRVHKMKFDININLKAVTIDHMNIRKNFQYYVENGKLYSKCTIDNCAYAMVGNHLSNLKRHLMKHNVDVFSTDGVGDEGNVSESAAVVVETESGCETAESTGVRKYFKSVRIYGKLFSTCLIKDCGHRFAGNHSWNMKKHLSASHNMMLDNQRKYFQTVTENGKLYSKCLVDGCTHRLSGSHRGNMKKHLFAHHNVKMNERSRGAPGGPRNYFQSIEIDGKLFSKCLVKDCNRQLAGKHRQNLERHLTAVHNMKSFSEAHENPSIDGYVEDFVPSHGQLSMGEGCDESSKTASEHTVNGRKISSTQPKSLENTDVRKHFERVEIDGKWHTKCMIDNCDFRSPSENLPCLKRHLLYYHKMSARSGVRPSKSKFEDVRENFEENRIDGKLYTKCLIENCNFRMLGRHLGNLKGHLIKHKADGARKYFKCFTENEKLFSKCLIEDCDFRLAGNHLYNLKRHLTHRHEMESFATKTKVDDHEDGDDNCDNDGDDDGILSDDDEDSTESSSARVNENTSRVGAEKSTNETQTKVNRLLENATVRKHFKSVEIEDKLHSQCLIDGCSSRLTGNHLYNLKRHLTYRHNMDSFAMTTKSNDDDDNDGDDDGILSDDALRSIDDDSTESNSFQVPENICSVGAEISNDPLPNASDSEENLHETQAKVNRVLENATVREHFKSIEIEGKLYSQCLIAGCGSRLTGNLLYNLKRHFRKHNTRVNSAPTEERNDSVSHVGNQKAETVKLQPPSAVISKTCRLCFAEKDDAIDIFSEQLNIASTVRLHFPADEVNSSRSLKMINHYWYVIFIYIISRSAKAIRYRNLCAQHVGRSYRNSMNFIFP